MPDNSQGWLSVEQRDDWTRYFGGVPYLRVIQRLLDSHASADRIIAELREAVAVAYQFCAVRSANVTLLDNLSALADGEKAPHSEWPIETGTWEWSNCGHHAGTACAECYTELREQLAAKDAEIADLRRIYNASMAASKAKDTELSESSDWSDEAETTIEVLKQENERKRAALESARVCDKCKGGKVDGSN